MVHLHGFGMSGAYLVPTAERLAGEFHTFVPDLPGFGRSGNSVQPLDVTDLAHAAAAFLDDRDIASATLVGNSMGCAVATYAVPRQWREEWGVRRYGFHGLSVAWSAERAPEVVGRRRQGCGWSSAISAAAAR